MPNTTTTSTAIHLTTILLNPIKNESVISKQDIHNSVLVDASAVLSIRLPTHGSAVLSIRLPIHGSAVLSIRLLIHGSAVFSIRLLIHGNSKLPAYTKRLCCTKPELTVYMSGTIKGVSHEDFED
ncbi:16032_t:CDS:2 [Funneliformis caledonium]|uniref:16032_t:CDS:1 n=1 Tax=Funneliformis caledonium TaxID=1117310 RepID=A0A9N9BRZ4_9GLOM|nr:16032_t:CDS:2 [Funneliformis caledonium]